MAFNKRTWKGRQGTGLNKFSINGASPVTVVNQPDSITEQGDALSAGNMNDLENRIYTAFEDEAKVDTALKAAIAKNTAEIENLKQTTGQQEITVSYPDDGNYSSLMPNKVPLSVADYAEVPRFRGKSRAWNQIAQNGDFSDGSNNWSPNGATSISVSSGIASFTATTAAGMIRQSCYFINGHKYLAIARVKTTTATNLVLLNVSSSGGGGIAQSVESTNWQTIYLIFTQSGNADNFIRIQDNRSSGWDEIQVDYVLCRDLTPIFPEGVPSTVAECVQKCPDLLKYDAYDAGSLVDTTITGAEAVGRNIFDKDATWTSAGNYILNDNGVQISDSSSSYYLEFLRVKPATSFYIMGTTSDNGGIQRLYFYDANKNFISRTPIFYNGLQTTPANCFYIRFQYSTGNLDMSKWCVSVSDALNGTYTPFQRSTIMLSSPFIGKSAGLVSDELDVESGVVTHKIYKKTFSASDSWEFSGAGNFFLKISDMSQVYYTTQISLLAEYDYDNTNSSIDKTYWNNGGYIWVRDTSFNGDTSAFASAMAGKKLNYALATPTTESIDPIPYNFLEIEGGGTVETIQTQSPVIDNCLDVTYDIIPQ